MAKHGTCSWISDERKEYILDEFVEMYIKNGGRMPPKRMIKKNSTLSEKEVDALRISGELSEQIVRRRAEKKTGREFLSEVQWQNQELLTRYRRETKPQENSEQKLETQQKTVQKKAMQRQKPVQTGVEPKQEVKKMRRAGKTRVSETEALEDLRALTEKLGHIPTQVELNDVENGAKYAYTTYVKRLGPKSDWSRLLGLEGTEAVSTKVEGSAEAAEVVEAETEEAIETKVAVTEVEVVNEVTVEKVTEVSDEKMRVVEIPLKVILPKEIKGTVTLSFEIN